MLFVKTFIECIEILYSLLFGINIFSIIFKEKEVRQMARKTAGVKAMRLKLEDKIVSMDILKKRDKNIEDRSLLIVTEKGFGKKVKLNQFRVQKKGGSGIRAIKVNQRSGDLIFSQILDEEKKDLILISKNSKIIRIELDTLPNLRRDAIGVKLMKLDSNDKTVFALCV